jgi:hypothetical protein
MNAVLTIEDTLVNVEILKNLAVEFRQEFRSAYKNEVIYAAVLNRL